MGDTSIYSQPTKFDYEDKNLSQEPDNSREPQPASGDPDYSVYYDLALKGEFGEVQRDAPQCGYYRLKGEDTGVGIWLDTEEGDIAIRIGDQDAAYYDADRHDNVWLSAAKRPVKKWCWWQYIQTGTWPDIPEDVSAEASTPYTKIVARAAGKIKQAEDWLSGRAKIADEVEADFARNLSESLRLIAVEADPMRRAEKIPIETKLKAIDEKYKAFTLPLSQKKGAIDNLVNVYLAEIEVKRRAEAARIAAENARIQAEAAKKAEAERKAAAKKGIEPEARPVFVPPPVIAEPPKVLIGGGRGIRTSFKEEFTAEVVDPIAAFLFLRAIDPALDEALAKSANAYAKKWKDKTNLPGCLVKNNLGAVICDNRVQAAAHAKTSSKKGKA